MHYFSENQSVELNPIEIDVDFFKTPTKLFSSKGVFSFSKIDKATNVLLKYLQTERGSKITEGVQVNNALDLGCGYGIIALTLAKLYSKSNIWAVDVNNLAVELTKMNSEKLNLNNIFAKLPEDVDKSIMFDLIVSNPPIRIGKTQLLELLERWLNKLTNNGLALFVIQKNLGANSIIKELNEGAFYAKKISASGGNLIILVKKNS